MSLHIEDVLEQQGVFISTTSGVSMYPMLRNRRDTIVIKPYCGRLKKYDVPLYRRGDRYLLHRIIKVLPDGYVICGDNCVTKEYDITDNEILGVLTEFYRKDKKINMNGFGYKAYIRVMRFFYPVRCLYAFARRIYGKFLRLIRGKNG